MPPLPSGAGRRRRMPSIRNNTRSPSVASQASRQPSVAPPSARPSPSPSGPGPGPKDPDSIQERYQCPVCPPEDSKPQELDGYIVCVSCGTEISDAPQYTTEIVFGETSQGAAVVQGTTLQDGQRHTHIPGLGFRHAAAPDADQRLQNATTLGKEEIKRLADRLSISDMIVDKAVHYYSLAKIHAFQRPIRENAAISLYTACRDQKICTSLLIDFAELIHMNVFDLGSAYKKFIERIGIVNHFDREKSNAQRLLEIEPLILRFAQRLEFGNDTRRVSQDASAILARMNRDWMITGRQPMGLIGACLIIAARMNNFRRTLREVVYVVRAGEMTILKRLNEFSATAAARLTVDQFRQLKANSNLNDALQASLPPAMAPPPAKKKRKTVRIQEPGEGIASTRQSSTAPSEFSVASSASEMSNIEVEKGIHRDKDGFVIPALPRHGSPAASPAPSLLSIESYTETQPESHNEWEEGAFDPDAPTPAPGTEDLPRRRGRPSTKNLPKVSVSEIEVQVESAIEKEIEDGMAAIEQDQNLINERGPGWFKARILADAARAEERQDSKWHHAAMDTLGEEIGEDEFEDDPEVKYCKLTEREVEAKERVWVTHNADWLRQQQEKILQEAMDKARGKRRKIGPRKNKSRRGDRSILGDTPVASPAEASSRMFAKRATRVAFSKHVNYEALEKIYQMEAYSDTSSQTGSPEAPSRSGSVAASPTTQRKHRAGSASTVSSGITQATSVASPSRAAAKRTLSEVDDEVEIGPDDEEEIPDEDLPTFGAEDEDEEEDQPDDADFMDQASQFGIDVGID